VPTDEDFKIRWDKRTRDEGKDIPDYAVVDMKANFSFPEKGEMFESVEFPELDETEATKLIDKYRDEARKKNGGGPPSEKRMRNSNNGRASNSNRRDSGGFGFNQSRGGRSGVGMGGGYNEFSSSKTGIRQLQNIRLNSSLRNNLASNNFNRYSANNNQRNNGGRGGFGENRRNNSGGGRGGNNWSTSRGPTQPFKGSNWGQQHNRGISLSNNSNTRLVGGYGANRNNRNNRQGYSQNRHNNNTNTSAPRNNRNRATGVQPARNQSFNNSQASSNTTSRTNIDYHRAYQQQTAQIAATVAAQQVSVSTPLPQVTHSAVTTPQTQSTYPQAYVAQGQVILPTICLMKSICSGKYTFNQSNGLFYIFKNLFFTFNMIFFYF